jgi:CubicO group peptidase (beta-lactamase class C family)
MSFSGKPLRDLEDAFLTSVNDGTWPGAVVAAVNRSGSFYYANAFGKDACGTEGTPLDLSSIMTIASMTKLLTSIAALQLVEKKAIDLDTDVSALIPTLGDQEILYGWDETGRPLTRKRTNAITLRSLLTHSSGAGYDMSNPELARYTAHKGRTINSGATVNERFGYPLVFEPSTAWEYGTGIDWVGQLIERLTGQPLEVYMKQNIWEPLDIKRMSFWPSSIKGGKGRVKMSVRDTATGLPIPLRQPFLTEGVTECFGGQGVYASMEDYLKVLRSILANDGKLLNNESIALMFQSQLTTASRECLQQHIFNTDPSSSFIGVYDNNRFYDWGLGGMLALENEASGRRKDTLFWSGKPNLFWVSHKISIVLL